MDEEKDKKFTIEVSLNYVATIEALDSEYAKMVAIEEAIDNGRFDARVTLVED